MSTGFVEVTGADDGLSHHVAQREYDAGLATGNGRYPAACGRSFPAAALITEPGRACRSCVAVTRAAGSPGHRSSA